MKITVTPECKHASVGTGRYVSSGQPFVGRHVVISADGVSLDGDMVVKRERRPRSQREAGHLWTTDNGRPEYNLIPWTGFRVTVEP